MTKRILDWIGFIVGMVIGCLCLVLLRLEDGLTRGVEFIAKLADGDQ